MGNLINILLKKQQNNEYTEFDDDNICPICLDPLKSHNIIILNCSHKFHASCIFKSLSSSSRKRCPLCRDKIKYDYPNIRRY